MGSCVNSMVDVSTLVSRYGYRDDSSWRGCVDLGRSVGKVSGMGSCSSAVRSASFARFEIVGG